MTTTAYDLSFIASDVAFTDNNGVVHTNLPFRKVKRIGEVVIGMAGCYECMIDFSNMVVDYVCGNSPAPVFPASIIARKDRDFIVMLHAAGACMKFDKLKNATDATVNNITQVPTVIGSGSKHVTKAFDSHKNAVVAVLEAIRQDPFTKGEVKYCSVHMDDIHNLELHAMSNLANTQITGLKAEIDAANDFMAKPENVGKSFRASTEVTYVGTPDAMPLDAGIALLQQGLERIRADYLQKK
ncbi:MAG: hypothetical protein JO142_04870 [Burkholderiales bacterium]|nr:hypothetical protein [Burkholderiales bacterium]